MTRVLGRAPDEGGPAGVVGRYLARDGSDGARVAVDLNRPHASAVVGKRGTGKSHTLGVLAEELARTPGVTGVVADPVNSFGTLDDLAAGRRIESPRIAADALPPRAWCDLLDVDPASAVGATLWRVASEASTLDGMRERLADATAADATRRAARNYLDLAASWDVFDPGGVDPGDLIDDRLTVLDLSALDRAPMNAVVRGVTDGVYRAALDADAGPLPWLLVDEAHAFVDGVAEPGLRRVLTRGRHPGVSVSLATQRPGALPAVALSQADILVAHRVTAETDLAALAESRPTYLRGSLADRLPTGTGEALVVDDATETAHTIRVRERETGHGGSSPRATGRSG